jgi:hypothetical protein
MQRFMRKRSQSWELRVFLGFDPVSGEGKSRFWLYDISFRQRDGRYRAFSLELAVSEYF